MSGSVRQKLRRAESCLLRKVDILDERIEDAVDKFGGGNKFPVNLAADRSGLNNALRAVRWILDQPELPPGPAFRELGEARDWLSPREQRAAEAEGAA